MEYRVLCNNSWLAFQTRINYVRCWTAWMLVLMEWRVQNNTLTLSMLFCRLVIRWMFDVARKFHTFQFEILHWFNEDALSINCNGKKKKKINIDCPYATSINNSESICLKRTTEESWATPSKQNKILQKYLNFWT